MKYNGDSMEQYSIDRKMRSCILVVATPTPHSGGGLRAYRSLQEYVKHFNAFLFIPWDLWCSKQSLRKSINYLAELKNAGVRFAGFSKLLSTVSKFREVTSTRLFEQFLVLITPSIASMKIGVDRYNAVVVLHEVWDAVYSGYILSSLFNTPNAVLLQLPPFYKSRRRLLNILRATLLWRELLSRSVFQKELLKIEAEIRDCTGEYLRRVRYNQVLRKYTLVLGVSKAIAVEMGDEWVDRVHCFDPGVSLDDKDLEIIRRVREKVKEKGNFVVFGGRPSVVKGLAEALITFKFISRLFPDLKLVLTGGVTPQILTRVKKVCRKLEIEDKVIFTGFISREKRFEIVAKAKLMLYPSHVDSYSYAVLESLYLGTPVVAYRIPAIEIYHGRNPGLKFVEEGDVEAFTVTAVNMLEKGVEGVEKPKIRSWREIMDEEVGILYKLISKQF